MIKKKKLTEKEVEEKFKRKDPYAGALLEEMNDNITILVEGQTILEHKIDRVDTELKEFRAEVNEKFDAHMEEIKLLRKNKAEKTDVALIDHRVTRLEQQPT